MTSHHGKATDETSIRPVSSLRSHFEQITHQDPQARTPLKRETQSDLLEPSATGSYVRQRLSLDSPRPNRRSIERDIYSSRDSRHDAVESDTPARPPSEASTWRRSRPVSSHSPIPRQNPPPSVAIHFPSSYSRNQSFVNKEPASQARNRPSETTTRQERDADVAAVGPVPNRATKPKLQSQSIRRPTFQKSMSEEDVEAQILPITSSSLATTQTRWDAVDSNIGDRISPFSTPPSSDDSMNDHPVTRRKPDWVVKSPAPPSTPDPENPAMPSRHAFENAQRQSPQGKQRPTMNAISITQSDRLAQSTLVKPPELPPRPDTASWLLSAPQPHSRPTSRVPLVNQKPGPIDSPNTLLSARGEVLDNILQSTLSPLQPRLTASKHTCPGPLLQQRDGSSSFDLPQRSMAINDWGPDSDRLANKKGNSLGGEYANGSTSSRRPPYARVGPHVIPTTYDTKLYDMCAGHACCVGQLVRVWDLSSAKVVLSLALGEKEVKATASAFKPGSKSAEEGSRLWVGTNFGGLQEIDIATHKVVSSNPSAHSGREIVKIHRYQNTMWTIDEDGLLFVWPPADGGLPTLGSMPIARKVSRGHICSIVVEGLLWFATKKDVRVFRPSADDHVGFNIKQQPASQPGVGEITSGAVVGCQLDKIYFGHNDGKVSIYSTTDLSCLGIISANVYKINCLVGAGTHLWAGFNTGKICVYDTRTQPWKVVKDYHAHEGPVISLSVDRSSLWTSGQLRVGSLSLDNTIRLWDGLLEDDWLESELRDNDVSWCNFEEIEALVMTWNAGASTPAGLRYGEGHPNILRLILPTGKAPDLLVFGFQELVDLEDKKLTAKTLFKGSRRKDGGDQEHMSSQYRDWRDHLVRSIEDHMPANESYAVLHTASMVGLFSCVFVKASNRPRISSVHGVEIKRGMGGLHGNKGALIVRFRFDDSSICLVNCHLAAGQTQTMHRNNDIAAILESFALPAEQDSTLCSNSFVAGGDGSMVLDHEICILNGDLNYRIDTMSRDVVLKAIHNNHLSKLLERDQLLVSRRKNPTFGLKAFVESPITFDPTYKYDVGSDVYDSSEKHRAPAWCDRILYRGPGKIKQMDYRRHELRISDHRPVTGNFKIRVKSILPAQREKVWQECQQRFDAIRRKVEQESK
ncbi:MAG: hypothetical protein L6R36_003356 [Xanthoria steineri]|nr:MAG: hypothetical protein L6R36_003356 [Xanthoria steineri]